MAAITFKFGVQSDISELDSAAGELEDEQPGLGRGRGLGAVEADLMRDPFDASSGDALASDIINGTHSGLENMAWLRRTVEDALEGRGFHVEFHGREVKLVLNEPLPSIPAWNPPTKEGLRNFSLLSWTSKMGTPSFSLPAGSPKVGGACPGADAGQTIVPLNTLVHRAHEVKRMMGGRPVRLAEAICQHCLAGDTRVLVRGRGLVRLDELDDGEFDVWSGLAWRRTRLVAQGTREVALLRTTWGHEITLTPDHKVLTDDGMIMAADLEPGQVLRAQIPNGPVFAFAEDAPLPTFDPGTRYRTALETSYPTTWSAEIGYTLGALLGDGTIHYRDYPTVSIVGAAEDRAVLDRVSAAVRSWCATDGDVVVRDNLARAHWRVKSLVQFFDVLGLDKRPEISARRAPASVWTASRAGVVGFLQGLFDTDGCASASDEKLEVSLASVSEGLLRDVQLLLGAFGVRSSICPYATSNRERAADGHHALYKLSIGGIDALRTFAEHVGFALPRKQQKLLDALAARRDVVGRATQPRVASVAALRIHVPVFDLLNVGDEHQFLANGITVSNCYAEGGQYSTGQVQFAQVLRYAWTKQAIADGSFVDVMDWAVKNADFMLDGGWEKIETTDPETGETRKERQRVDPERVEHDGTRGLYFRLHDSGDYWSMPYIAAWREIADRNPDITFWSPSRVWAVRSLREAVNVYNTPVRNLIIRPSAYHINEPPPSVDELGTGWSAGSCAFKDTKKPSQESRLGPNDPYQWDCQAYQTDNDKVTCRGAMAPDGQKGCRACWRFGRSDEHGRATGLVINYTLH